MTFFNTTEAARRVATVLRKERVSKSEFLAKFPQRPNSRLELAIMTDWIVARNVPATEGMYRKDGQIYKVVRAVHGSGHLYAKRLDVDSQSFETAKGMVAKLSQADRMSTAEAAEFGRLYGFCVRCGIILTREESIARGMGLKCASKI